jgi:flagellar motor switch protein FliM
MAGSPQAIPLVRAQNETVDLAALEPLAAKLARGVQAVLDSRVAGEIEVTAGSANAARYPEWRIAQNPYGALLHFGPAGGDVDLLIHLPGYLLSQIVDLHYGGCGTVPIHTEFTAAELQFVARIGERFALLLETAGLGPVRFGEAQTDLLQAGLPKSREAISVQPFTCEGGAIKPAVISLILSAEAASRLSKRSESYSVNEAPTDAAWTDRMRAAAMRVQLPARTILARSDVSFQRLLTLSPGDVLPLLLPAQIPLTVAGHIFAHGSLGEANGRAALLIEKMEKEMDQ